MTFQKSHLRSLNAEVSQKDGLTFSIEEEIKIAYVRIRGNFLSSYILH